MAGRRTRALGSVERALWRAAMRDVEPLPGHALPPEPAPVAADPVPAEPAPMKPAPVPRGRPLPVPTELPVLTYVRTPGLDRRTSERLKRGQMPIEAPFARRLHHPCL